MYRYRLDKDPMCLCRYIYTIYITITIWLIVLQAVTEPRNEYESGLLSKSPEQVQQLLQL